MSTKGKRKYQCRDCNATRMVHWLELNRAAQPRCHKCGGMLDPYSPGAHDQRHIGDRNVREFDAARGDLIPAKGTSAASKMRAPWPTRG